MTAPARRVSARLAAIAPSATLAVDAKAKALKAAGKNVIGFIQLARNSGLVLAGKNDTDFDPAKPETIKGKNVGITAPGSSSDFFIRYFLKQHGLTDDDISIIGVGSGAAAVAALQQGKIDLLVNYDPAATIERWTRTITRLRSLSS